MCFLAIVLSALVGCRMPAKTCSTAQITAPPDRPEQALREARALTTSGRYAEARALYTPLLATEPHVRDARLGLARTYAWEGCFDHAAEQYQALLRLNPNDVEALPGWIDILLWTGRPDEARRELSRGLALAPNTAELWFRRARIALWDGERSAALEDSDRAERLSPNDLDIRAFRDRLYRGQWRAGALLSRFPSEYPQLYVAATQAQHYLGRLELGAEAQLIARVGGELARPMLDGLYGANFYYHTRYRFSLGLGGAFGAPDHSIPRWQLRPSAFYQLTTRWFVALTYAYWSYRTNQAAHIINPSLGYQLNDRLLLELRSLNSYIVLTPPRSSEMTREQKLVLGGGVRASMRVNSRLGFAGGYTYGPQVEQVSGYQFLASTSHVVNVSGDWMLHRRVGIQPALTFERRRNDRNGVIVPIYSAELASYFRW